jgi:hypothetical protein
MDSLTVGAAVAESKSSESASSTIRSMHVPRFINTILPVPFVAGCSSGDSGNNQTKNAA